MNSPINWSTSCVLVTFSLLIANFTPQLNCQRQQMNNHHQAHPVDKPCNQQRYHLMASTRHQRQFNPQETNQIRPGRAAMLLASEDGTHEEFSLNSGNQSAGQAQVDSLSQRTNDTREQQTTRGSPAPETFSANTTPTLTNDTIASSVIPQPPVTTTSSISQTSSTTSTSSSRSLNSMDLTTESIDQRLTLESNAAIETKEKRLQVSVDPTVSKIQEPTLGQVAGTHHGTSRHIEDKAILANNLGHQSDPPNIESNEPSQSSNRHLSQSSSSHSRAISSSPSSISIITPLLTNPNQNQQTHAVQSLTASIGSHQQADSGRSSAMVKPIYVLGNPISEPDYNSATSFEGQNQQLTDTETNQVNYSLAGDFSKTNRPADTSVQPNAATRSPSAKRVDLAPSYESSESNSLNITGSPLQSNAHLSADRMSGPTLVYSDGQLSSVVSIPSTETTNTSATFPANSQVEHQQQQPSPRLFQGPANSPGAAVLSSNPRRPSLPPPVNQANAASGFRSPLSSSGPLLGLASTNVAANSLATNPSSYYQTSPPYAGNGAFQNNPMANMYSPQSAGQNSISVSVNKPNSGQQANGLTSAQVPQIPNPSSATATGVSFNGRRPINITRVEHISAECSNDLIRAVIVFNGTFKGIIYSSGYVSDPSCLYVNGTGLTRYEFSIRLNQCGTLGRQELHQPTIPGEAREWDEHFRVSCEYGSDFWKTVSFSPFNVETNTGSPVTFTINPPQCQMDVLLGHGMGPKIAVDGPVTVGDPLTLLIHMKSEKAGYDILVKNCVAHNGGKQRMQLIDSNGCVVNERFISPFRGTYNDNDLRHVTLYAYLKAFRFTGSPVLYLECEIHMCQSACPPQMCYWRRLSKRSVDNSDYEYTTALPSNSSLSDQPQIISDSLNLFKALQVRQDPEPTKARQVGLKTREVFAEDDEASLVCYRPAEVFVFLGTTSSLFLLTLMIAVGCCLKIRKLTRGQYKHNKLAICGSISPSLNSISDAVSSAGSLISGAAAGSLLCIPGKSVCPPPLAKWHLQQSLSSDMNLERMRSQQESYKRGIYSHKRLPMAHDNQQIAQQVNCRFQDSY